MTHKRLLAWVLAIVMCFSAFSVTALAAATEDPFGVEATYADKTITVKATSLDNTKRYALDIRSKDGDASLGYGSNSTKPTDGAITWTITLTDDEAKSFDPAKSYAHVSQLMGGSSNVVDKDFETEQTATYTVTFDVNKPEGASGDVTAPEAQTIEEGKTATKPADPALEGYTFDGWFEGDAETAFDFATPITADITLTAKWTENTVTPEPTDEPQPTDKPQPTDEPQPSEDPQPSENLRVYGKVVDKDGNGIEGLAYTITAKGVSFSGVTGKDGAFELDGNAYKISADVAYSIVVEDTNRYEGTEEALEVDELNTIVLVAKDGFELTADRKNVTINRTARVTANMDVQSGSWKSSDTAVATVAAIDERTATVTAIKRGTVIISATNTEGVEAEVSLIITTGGVVETGGGPSGGGSTTPDTIRAGASMNGTYTVSNTAAKAGDKVTITPKANTGYVTDAVKVTDAKGNALEVTKNADGTYSFTMPASDAQPVRTEVTFKQQVSGGNAATPSFVDVPADAYYADAVKWAVANGITNGIDSTHFGPENACTRAQFVTFLWRAAGCPEPESTETDFTDLGATDSYYYKAVLWAVEQGITNGTGADTFSPNATVTRGQVVTFLFRFEKAAAGDENPFVDVDEDAYYADAVAWAVAEHITNGTSDTTFSPENNCTRGQIVTFLYRDMAE